MSMLLTRSQSTTSRPPETGRMTLHEFTASREFEERVYAGVLGKMIGVYLGRPFENWSHERIVSELGEVGYYVNDRLGQPLVVTDDDLSGTFTFVRALAENGYDPDITAEQIGDWWLNTTVQDRSIFWWGGMGVSTEHTAYLRLKAGIKAPLSGSIALNGATSAQQIGAQIFIDGWGMVSPGDPGRAADFAKRAGSVSHDGEAVYAAQVIAAMEALAFVEPDLDRILDTAVTYIPGDSVIYRMIADIREWADANAEDWRKTLESIHGRYGYDKFGGVCHAVPNHALIHLGILHGRDDFQRALMITNTAGWDTDCNSGNVGCFMGIKTGLSGIDAGPDWRGPLADRMYLSTADGGRGVTDAVRETYHLVDTARALQGLPRVLPKNGARFHFSLPGSVQGFLTSQGQTLSVTNSGGRLCLRLDRLTSGRVATSTFTPPDALKMPGYPLVASPVLYSGQTVTAEIEVDELSGPAEVRLYVGVYGPENALQIVRGSSETVTEGRRARIEMRVPDTHGQPVAEVGLEITAPAAPASGGLCVDSLTWSGTPDIELKRPDAGTVWTRAWVNGATRFDCDRVAPGMTYRLIQDEGLGIASQGEWTWTDYRVSAKLLPHLVSRTGLIACLRGLRRYIALELEWGGRVRLIAQRDDIRSTLLDFEGEWRPEEVIALELCVSQGVITASAFGEVKSARLNKGEDLGAIGMLIESGSAEFGDMCVRPLRPPI